MTTMTCSRCQSRFVFPNGQRLAIGVETVPVCEGCLEELRAFMAPPERPAEEPERSSVAEGL